MEQVDITGEEFIKLLIENKVKFNPHKLRYKITDNILIGENILEAKSIDIDTNGRKFLNIRNCIFSGLVEIKGINSPIRIIFDYCEFPNSLTVAKVDVEELNIQQCKISVLKIYESIINTLLIANGTCVHLTLGSNAKYNLNYIYLSAIEGKRLCLYNTEFGDISMDNAKFSSMEINPLSYNEDIENIFKNEDKFFYKKIKTIIRSLNIKVDETLETSYVFKNLIINKLDLSGILKNQSILFKNIEVKSLNINDFINEGRLRFHNIKLLQNGEGSITDSILGKAEFNGVDLISAVSFNIYLSNLTEITTTNTAFPYNISGKTNKDYSEIRESFRQLKYASSKQGDRIKELHYEQLEMTYYEKSLAGSESWTDKFILLTNRLSNNHGQSWFRALLWFILISLIFYIIIKIELGYKFVLGVPTGLDISQYLESSLNPLHDFNKIFTANNNGSISKAKFFDSLSKIASGYLIFQFLRAFRKYAK